MRPYPLLLAAALLVFAASAPLSAADPSPSATPTAPGPSDTQPAASPTGPTPAADAAVQSTPPETAPAAAAAETPRPPDPTPAAEPTETTPPAPQVITAQIDPELALRLSLLEKTMLAQSQGQAAIYSETTRLLMFFGSACVAMGLIAMVAAVFLINRTLASVSAITVQVAQSHGGMPALPASGALMPAGPGPSGFEKVQASGQRFQGRMTSLEQRLEELENLAGQGGASKSADRPAAAAAAAEPESAEEPPAPRRVIPVSAILVRKSETLMNLGKLDEAMAALDEAARHDGDPAELHLARGRVQEKLGRLGDALHSYDMAVSNDQTSTAALLMKAGVLNRQERFDEALTCYERALAVHRAAN